MAQGFSKARQTTAWFQIIEGVLKLIRPDDL
jgi:hypothetical protein